MPRSQKDFTYDAATLLRASAATTADTAGSVVTLGAGRLDGRAIFDVTALVTGGAAPESYALTLQFSNSATFASGVVGGAAIRLGTASTLPGESANSAVGRYEVSFSNEVNGTVYSYVRVYTDVSGTAPSITYSAFIVQRA